MKSDKAGAGPRLSELTLQDLTAGRCAVAASFASAMVVALLLLVNLAQVMMGAPFDGLLWVRLIMVATVVIWITAYGVWAVNLAVNGRSRRGGRKAPPAVDPVTPPPLWDAPLDGPGPSA